jgi:sensor histidine kinase YesM
VEDEIEKLEMYFTLEQFCSGNQFNFTIEVQNDLDQTEIMIPPMLIQPFIENSIIHGIKHLNEKGKINVSFKAIENILECSITDNGIGRKKAAEIKSQEEHHHKSTALFVTQERLDILNKEKGFHAIKIIDLTNNDETACGTQVIIRIPIEN